MISNKCKQNATQVPLCSGIYIFRDLFAPWDVLQWYSDCVLLCSAFSVVAMEQRVSSPDAASIEAASQLLSFAQSVTPEGINCDTPQLHEQAMPFSSFVSAFAPLHGATASVGTAGGRTPGLHHSCGQSVSDSSTHSQQFSKGRSPGLPTTLSGAVEGRPTTNYESQQHGVRPSLDSHEQNHLHNATAKKHVHNEHSSDSDELILIPRKRAKKRRKARVEISEQGPVTDPGKTNGSRPQPQNDGSESAVELTLESYCNSLQSQLNASLHKVRTQMGDFFDFFL